MPHPRPLPRPATGAAPPLLGGGSALWTAGSAAALALAACGVPLVGTECADGYVQKGAACVPRVDAAGDTGGGVSPSCAQNADCAQDEVCLAGQCTVAGACVIDAHCPCSTPTCQGHACTGAGSCQGAPVPCQINADCPSKFYCIQGLCAYATECVDHAECPAGYACFSSVCWKL